MENKPLPANSAEKHPNREIPNKGLLSDSEPNEGGLVEPAPTRDIGEASFGRRVTTESTIGIDDRVRVINTSVFPYRAISYLEIWARGGALFYGTGWFIGPRTLLTAGHCVYVNGSQDVRLNGPVTKIVVHPGRNGNAPGPVRAEVASRWEAHEAWKRKADTRYDYGVIWIESPLGAVVGTFGYAAFANSVLKKAPATIAGYPNSHPKEQWKGEQRITQSDGFRLLYPIDTGEGQSGSPIFTADGVAVGIHTSFFRVLNEGVRITPAVITELEKWKL